MKLTDTHCHLYWDKFDEDREAVIQRAVAAGVTRILVPGVAVETSKQAVELAERYEKVYAAVGVHPTDAETLSETNIHELFRLAEHEKVIAIGEIGLDYYWVKEEQKRAVQRETLRRQLQFAAEIQKPVVIHMREEGDAWTGAASQDLLEILTEWRRGLPSPLRARPGVLHSFNGDLETAQEAIALNFFIGVTGPVTYKSADKKREIIRQLPMTQLLIETDAPFLAPAPQRGKRNEPAYVLHIADKIAEIHSKSPAEVASATTANAARLFAWGD
jgi:TatD DNase family protein